MVISNEVFGISSLRNSTVLVRGNCRRRQPRNNSRDYVDVNRRKAEGTRDICEISIDH